MARPKYAIAAKHPMVAQLLAMQDEQGMPNTELAARTGITHAKISRIRRGWHSVTIEEVELIAAALRMRLVLAPRI